MEAIYAEFGEKLKAARIAKGRSQAYLANYVGLNRTSITNIEQGRQRFPFHVVYQLAEALSTSVSALLPDRNPVEAVPADVMTMPEDLRTWAMTIRERAGEREP